MIGPVLFHQDAVVYLSLAAFALVAWVLAKTRLGLLLKAVGESPRRRTPLAIGAGHPLWRGAVWRGNGRAGRAYLSTVYTPLWVQNMSAGRGWIAVALVVFAAWKPGRLLLGAYLFGAVTILQFHAQGLGIALPVQLLAALPYLATIVVLVLISRDRRLLQLNLPASLGKPYLPERLTHARIVRLARRVVRAEGGEASSKTLILLCQTVRPPPLAHITLKEANTMHKTASAGQRRRAVPAALAAGKPVFPTLNGQPPLIIAHRGASGLSARPHAGRLRQGHRAGRGLYRAGSGDDQRTAC